MENFDMENGKPSNGNYGTILTTPEAIVREHRKHWDTIHHDNFKSQDHQGPVGNLNKTENHRGSTLELVGWTLLIACLIYLSIFVFGPFLLQVFGSRSIQ